MWRSGERQDVVGISLSCANTAVTVTDAKFYFDDVAVWDDTS